MKHELRNVELFMEAADQIVRYSPVTHLSRDETFLRLHLIRESFENFRESLGVNDDGFGWSLYEPLRPVDTLTALQSLTDLLYVTFGTFHSLGLGQLASQAFEEVHKANMSKLNSDGKFTKAPTGRILKGPNYCPPDLKSLIHPPSSASVFDQPTTND